LETKSGPRQTRERARKKLLPILEEGFTVVVPGFIGLSHDRKITTLGRGGSDISAVVLGNCLEAREVVFVKDVGGILSADPKKVSSPQMIDSLMVDEAYSSPRRGQGHQPKALAVKESTVLRVVADASDSTSTRDHGRMRWP
jgi:aspartate kinase